MVQIAQTSTEISPVKVDVERPTEPHHLLPNGMLQEALPLVPRNDDNFVRVQSEINFEPEENASGEERSATPGPGAGGGPRIISALEQAVRAVYMTELSQAHRAGDITDAQLQSGRQEIVEGRALHGRSQDPELASIFLRARYLSELTIVNSAVPGLARIRGAGATEPATAPGPGTGGGTRTLSVLGHAVRGVYVAELSEAHRAGDITDAQLQSGQQEILAGSALHGRSRDPELASIFLRARYLSHITIVNTAVSGVGEARPAGSAEPSAATPGPGTGGGRRIISASEHAVRGVYITEISQAHRAGDITDAQLQRGYQEIMAGRALHGTSRDTDLASIFLRAKYLSNITIVNTAVPGLARTRGAGATEPATAPGPGSGGGTRTLSALGQAVRGVYMTELSQAHRVGDITDVQLQSGYQEIISGRALHGRSRDTDLASIFLRAKYLSDITIVNTAVPGLARTRGAGASDSFSTPGPGSGGGTRTLSALGHAVRGVYVTELSEAHRAGEITDTQLQSGHQEILAGRALLGTSQDPELASIFLRARYLSELTIVNSAVSGIGGARRARAAGS